MLQPLPCEGGLIRIAKNRCVHPLARDLHQGKSFHHKAQAGEEALRISGELSSGGGEVLRIVARAGAVGVFSERHITGVMRLVFNAPAPAVELEQPLSVGLLSGEAGDAVGHVGGRLEFAGFPITERA
jgi:hypothetical protein